MPCWIPSTMEYAILWNRDDHSPGTSSSILTSIDQRVSSFSVGQMMTFHRILICLLAVIDTPMSPCKTILYS